MDETTVAVLMWTFLGVLIVLKLLDIIGWTIAYVCLTPFFVHGVIINWNKFETDVHKTLMVCMILLYVIQISNGVLQNEIKELREALNKKEDKKS